LGVLETARAEEFRMSWRRPSWDCKKEGVAVIKLGVNERGCDSASSGKVEGVSYPSKVANR